MFLRQFLLLHFSVCYFVSNSAVSPFTVLYNRVFGAELLVLTHIHRMLKFITIFIQVVDRKFEVFCVDD